MTFPADLTTRLVIALNGCTGPKYFQAGDANLYPGTVVMEDDQDEVCICTSTGHPIGVVGCDADHDLNTAYSSGERVPVYMLGCGVELYVRASDADTITVVWGAIMDTADDTSLKGTIRVKDTFVVVTTAGTSTERNVSSAFWVGRAMADGSISSAVERFVPVKLSF